MPRGEEDVEAEEVVKGKAAEEDVKRWGWEVKATEMDVEAEEEVGGRDKG